MSPLNTYRPDPRHPQLGAEFYDSVEAAAFPNAILRYRNERWAARVGLGTLDETTWLRHFAHFEPLPDNLQSPLALRYHGHQFQQYNPELGDGRGFLFAQLRDCVDDRLLDLGTKGSGQTPWSRGGDGRLTLKGGVREALATALLEALGVYTSKTFSLVETGEELWRNDEPSPTRSSVLVRLSHSHIRIGSFQRQAYLKDSQALCKLVDYSIANFYPELQPLDDAERPAALLRNVAKASAKLAASWMSAGFVHGVLNTDNLNLTGESFDYGPFRFLPTLDPGFTAAYFDHSGLYAYGRQPAVVAWNLERLAEALLLVCEKDLLIDALGVYQPNFNAAYHAGTLTRLGLALPKQRDEPQPLDPVEIRFVNDLYQFFEDSQVGFEQFFFDWYGGTQAAERAQHSPSANKYDSASFAALRKQFDRYAPARPDAHSHEYFARGVPCTLLIDEIETLWSAIADRDDWSLFEAKLVEIETMRSALRPE